MADEMDFTAYGDQNSGATTPDTNLRVPVAAPQSPLDAFRAELARDIALEPLVLRVPSRPDITITYDTNIPSETLEAWRKSAMKRTGHGAKSVMEMDALKLALIVLSNQARSIEMRGTVIPETSGAPMLFYSSELLEMLSAINPTDCIRKFYGADGHVILAADAVVDAAGYGPGNDDEVDPTSTER